MMANVFFPCANLQWEDPMAWAAASVTSSKRRRPSDETIALTSDCHAFYASGFMLMAFVWLGT